MMRFQIIGLNQVMQELLTIEDEVKASLDKAMRRIANKIETNMRINLISNGSVATGEGISSLDTVPAFGGSISYAVIGRRYLEAVDSGTRPHSPRINHRFRTWASLHGWHVVELSSHIERFGTRPHPFIDRSIKPVKRTTKSRVQTNLQRTFN